VSFSDLTGYRAIILTVDSSRFGYREADWRNGFSGLPEGLALANYPTPKGWDDQRAKGWDQNSETLLVR
jgi:(S)-2-hydroxy-acid oxidase